MKKFLLLFFLFAGLQSAYSQKIEPRPVPPTAVNDFGNMLEPFQKQALEQKLRNYNDSTSSAIVIVTVPDLQGYDIAEVGLKYLRDWGIGNKEKDNGVLVKDEVKYQLPFGIFGDIAHALFVKNKLKSIFDYRSIVLQKMFPIT